MEDIQRLKVMLDAIPQSQRLRLDQKLVDSESRARIARCIGDWKSVVQYLPNIKNISSIDDGIISYEQQKINLLEVWLDEYGQCATYCQLAEALNSSGEMKALEELVKELEQHIYDTKNLLKPTMKDLLMDVKVTNPYDFGIHLNLEQADLDIIRANYPTDHSRQRSDVFKLYLQRTVEPSWMQIIKALQAIGENRLAKELMQKYGFESIRPSEPLNTTIEQDNDSVKSVLSALKTPHGVIAGDSPAVGSGGNDESVTENNDFVTENDEVIKLLEPKAAIFLQDVYKQLIKYRVVISEHINLVTEANYHFVSKKIIKQKVLKSDLRKAISEVEERTRQNAETGLNVSHQPKSSIEESLPHDGNGDDGIDVGRQDSSSKVNTSCPSSNSTLAKTPHKIGIEYSNDDYIIECVGSHMTPIPNREY